MKSTVIIFKNFLDYISYPLIFVSALLTVIYSIPSLSFAGAAELTLAFLFPLFVVYYALKSFKKAAVSAFCVFSSCLVFYGFSGSFYSVLFSALLSFLCVKALGGIKYIWGAAGLFIICVAIGAGSGLSYEYLYSLLKIIAKALADKGALFGTVNSFFELAVSPELSKLVYRTSYSGAVVDMNGIKSGVADILAGRGVAKLLTGKYLVNISLTIGIFAVMFKRLKGAQLTAFCSICFVALVFGDARLLCLYILFYNPVLYIGYLFCVFVAYFIPSLIDLRIGFKFNASLFELFRYGNRWGYFIILAFVIAVLTYFVLRLIFSRFDIMKGRYLPKSVKIIVNALGGENNLERIEGETLYVKNPNLIDILKIDCEIRQNAVSLYSDEIELLKEYFYESS